MPGSDTATIDFAELKRRVMGSDQSNPVGCAVALYGDKSVGLLVDRKRSGKALAAELRKEASASGSYFHGAAYIDTFPGTLCLALNRAPSALEMRVRLALRGSGFGKVEVTTAEGDEEG